MTEILVTGNVSKSANKRTETLLDDCQILALICLLIELLIVQVRISVHEIFAGSFRFLKYLVFDLKICKEKIDTCK